MTPEEELVDFEPDESFWQDWFKWAEACDMAAEEQYKAELRQAGEP
jgi:hypothetical protein